MNYLNSMHIKARFDYVKGNLEEMQYAVHAWRHTLVQYTPRYLHKHMAAMPDTKMLKTMDMLKSRIMLLKDLD